MTVHQGRQNGGDGALDVADLDGAGVQDLDGVGIVGVEGLTDQTHHFTATDITRVVLSTDYISYYEADHVGFGGRLGL